MSETPISRFSYVAAALAAALLTKSADYIRVHNTVEDMKRIMEECYSVNIQDDILDITLDMMHDLKLIVVDDDEFAGRFVTAQKTRIERRLTELSHLLPDSPFAVVARGRTKWAHSVLSNTKFWQELNDEFEENGDAGPDVVLDDVPASDRIVTILHNSAERVEIVAQLDRISIELSSNNAVAVELGDERERLLAEIKASRTGFDSEKIRVGFLKDLVLRALRELGRKLGEKAADLGIDRLIQLVEHLANMIF